MTQSSGFPTNNPYDNSLTGGSDAFVAKFQNGVRIYSTFLGGSGTEIGTSIAVPATDKVFVTGNTSSSNFPTSTNGFDRSYNGTTDNDVFVVKLDLTLAGSSQLVYGTFLGGSGDDGANSIAVSVDNVYITGGTASGSTGTGSLKYGSFFGGVADDWGFAIAADANGKAYITGATESSTFPTLNAYDISYNGGRDAFVASFDLNTTGSSSFVYSPEERALRQFNAHDAQHRTVGAFLVMPAIGALMPLMPRVGANLVFAPTRGSLMMIRWCVIYGCGGVRVRPCSSASNAIREGRL